MDYLLHLLIMISIYLILSYGLNLVVGFGGLLSLCYAAFYGIGAYATALLMMKGGVSFIPAIFISSAIAGCCALSVGIPALRFRGDPFIVVTLAFQMIIFTLLYNWVGLTRGPYGIPGIPRPVILGYGINSPLEYLIVSATFLLILVVFLFTIYRSPFGLALRSLREDEMAAEALGKSSFHVFLSAFVISGIVASVAGGFYASYVTFIDPTSFTLDESIFLLTILLVGGSGNKAGPFIGTLLMVLLPEGLRLIGLPDAVAANIRQMIYGLTLIFLMFVRPKGISGEYFVK
jgi:branched-chain amino acid transport system permease protein